MGTTTLSSYTGSGIVLSNSGAYQSPFTITADGTVSALGGTGVYSNGTASSLLNQGLVTAASGIGVEFMHGGAVTNSGAAGIAGWTGVELQGAGAALLNAGTVTGTSGDGALFTYGGYVYNSATGTIAGTTDGVQMQNTGGTLVNDGLVTGATIGAALQGTGYIRNIGTGAAIDGATGVYIAMGSGLFSGTVYNEGTIAGSGGGDYGVQVGGGGTVVNAGTAALISGYKGVVFQTASGTVLNDGTIAGNGTGVQLDHGGTVTNSAGADITAGSYAAVRIEAGGGVLNAGTITSASAGVVFNASGTLSNLASGVISGKYNAVEFLQGSGAIYNAGTIGAGIYGKHAILLDQGGAVTNTGSISILSAYSYAIQLAGGTVLNQGVITANARRADGIILNGAGAITNSGTVIAGYRGIELGGTGDTLSNSGSIAGSYAIYASGFGDTVTNSGAITGTKTAVKLGGGATLINSGTLTGGVDAAAFGGNAVLVVEAGAVFTGNVVANGGGNTLVLGAGGGRLDGIGNQITGFNTIAFLAGAAWTLSGSGLGEGEIINGFTLGDAIILDDFAATSETILTGTGIVLSDGQTSVTLDMGSSLAVADYKFTTADGNTEIELRPRISFTGINRTISGSIAALASGEAIEGFTLADALILDGFAETSETFVNGTGIILPNGTNTETIVVSGSFGSGSFLETSDGTNTTITLAPATLSSANSGVTLVNYESLVIAASGQVLPGSAGVVAVTGPAGITRASVLNFGSILGATGAIGSYGAAKGTAGTGGNAGGALLLQSVITITNGGLIGGGAGGSGGLANAAAGGGGGNGGNGGNAISTSAGGTLVNYGQILAGAGGAGSNSNLAGMPGVVGGGGTGHYRTNPGGNGGIGGIGIAVTGGAERITNTGVIAGGNGGNGGSGGQFSVGGTGASGGNGIDLASGGIVVNSGQITAGSGGKGGGGYYYGNGAAGAIGVDLANNSSLFNTGTITGGAGGQAGLASFFQNPVGGAGGSAIVSAAGDYLMNGGTITGGTGGASNANRSNLGVSGNGGVGIAMTGGTLVNSGKIIGGNGAYYYDATGGSGGNGVNVQGGAILTNTGYIAGGTGANVTFFESRGVGGAGVEINGGMLIDRGTITGAAGGVSVRVGISPTYPTGQRPGATGDAVGFGALAGTLAVESGAVFNGNVVANASVADVLELSGTSAAALTGIGTQFTNFADISFATGAAWTIAGNTAGLAGTLAGGQGITISGLTGQDTIDLTGIAATSVSFSSGVLSLYGVGGLLATLHVAEAGNVTSADFSISSDHGGGTDITLCFYPGTQLAGEYGTVAVEDITPGTMLKTAAGALMPVRWVGQSHVSTRFTDRLRCLPIRIKAGALGENLPRRDLLVSPDHALFIDGLLIQAGALVNGENIIRDASVPEQFTYYHVELASHELLLAEGVPTESFVDNVDRMHFHNWALHEDLVDMTPIEEMPYPRAKSYRQVPNAIHKMIAAGATQLPGAEAAA